MNAYVNAYQDGFDMGYEEGLLIGSLEVSMRLVESGYMTVSQAADRNHMTVLEYMMKTGCDFETIDSLLKTVPCDDEQG